MIFNELKAKLAIFSSIIFLYSCVPHKIDKAPSCGNHLKFDENKIGIKKIDTLNYEEGNIYNILTNDSSSILILCGGNASLLDAKKYVIIDSTYVKGSLSLRGVDNETKLYWRKYKNMAYVGVKEKDLVNYDNLLNSVNLD